MDCVTIYDIKHDADRKCILVKLNVARVHHEGPLKNSGEVYDVLREIFDFEELPEERLYLICCDNVGKIIGIFIVSSGTVNGTLTNKRGIFIRALLCNASGIILAHNHPSGEVNLSKFDLKSYKSLKRACKLMEITLIDFVICGKDCYASCMESFEAIKRKRNI